MERLTERFGDGYIAIKGCTSAYKDVKRKNAPAANAIVCLAAYEDAMPLERAQELAQAEKDGRLVVLPLEAKNGDPIPQCFYGDDGLCPGLSESSDDEPIEMCKRCWYCSTGYHWQAEAAMEKREADDETD